ncbi:hypothetical protein F5887DRAFT_990566, partial [Amanita rubescens]
MNKCTKKFDHIVDCVAKLHNLRKLSFQFIYAQYIGTSYTRPKINSVAKIIAANPNITHLEHLISSSLTSVNLADSDILKELLKQNIFPPTMMLWMMDQYTIEYLDGHPGIVSLTSYGYSDVSYCSTLLRILSRHSETLTHLGFCHWILYKCIEQTQNELALLQCTNLKQLALNYRPTVSRHVAAPGLQMACVACSRLCSRSQNPLLRDLARRIVFQFLDDPYEL